MIESRIFGVWHTFLLISIFYIPELGKVSVESERHEEAGVLRLRVRLGGVERTVERDPGGVHLLACHQVYAVTIWHI